MVGHFFGLSLLPQALERLGPKQHAVDAFPPVQLDGMREQRKHQGAHYQESTTYARIHQLSHVSLCVLLTFF